jgi:ssDNA-binding Zn-finger/Zn-ribbon topoisomerase 1
MGSHSWYSQCPHCDFEEMIVSSFNDFYFDANCPICGYSRWTEERVPEIKDIDVAKRKLGEMNASEKDNAIEQFYEDGIPFIARFKNLSK